MEKIYFDEIMNKLSIIEKKNDNVFEHGYVIIDKYFLFDVIICACFAFVVIGGVAHYFNFI